MATMENEAAVYQTGMEQLKQSFPVPLAHIASEHQRLHTLAIQEFIQRGFKDDYEEYLKSLEKDIGELFDQYLHHNEEASKKKCQEFLSRLSADMTGRLQKGSYSKPRGYRLFCQHMEVIVDVYNRQTANSVKAKEVLEEFFKTKHVESEAIRKADLTLSKEGRLICEETEKAYLLRQKMSSEEEQIAKMEAKRKADMASFEEKMKQIEAKKEEEKKREEEEFGKVLKGLESQAAEGKQEVEDAKRKHEESQAVQDKKFEAMMESFRMDWQEQDKHYEKSIAQMVQRNQQTILQIRSQNERALSEMQQYGDSDDSDVGSDESDTESHCTIL